MDWLKFRKVLAILIGLALTVVVSGCGESDGNEDDDSPDYDQALIDKMNYYSDCINRCSNRIFHSRHRYLSWIDDPGTGPTGQEDIVYGLYPICDTLPCADNVASGNSSEPSVPELENAAEEYKNALLNLYPIIEELHVYYEQDDYFDDGMAKGKQMHEPLIAGFERFDQADGNLKIQLDIRREAVGGRKLEQFQQEGDTLSYLRLKSMMVAEDIIDEGLRSDISRIGPDLLTACIGEYESVIGELESFVAENGTSEFDWYIDDSNEYLTRAKKLMRRVRDDIEYTSAELQLVGDPLTEWMVEGSPGRLLHFYNRLADTYNNLNSELWYSEETHPVLPKAVHRCLPPN